MTIINFKATLYDSGSEQRTQHLNTTTMIQTDNPIKQDFVNRIYPELLVACQNASKEQAVGFQIFVLDFWVIDSKTGKAKIRVIESCGNVRALGSHTLNSMPLKALEEVCRLACNFHIRYGLQR